MEEKMDPIETNVEDIKHCLNCSENLDHPRKSFKENVFPTSPLGFKSQNSRLIELPPDDNVDNDPIELYQKICDVERFVIESQVACNLTSYDNESRINSNVECDNNVEGDVKHVVTKGNKKRPQQQIPPSNKKPGKITKGIHSRVKSLPPSRPKMQEKNNNVNVVVQKPPLEKKSINKGLRRPASTSSLEQKSSKDLKKGIDRPDLGSYFLKKAKDIILSGEDPKKAIEFAIRAKKSFENCPSDKSNLDYVICLHILASIYCNLGQYDEAIPLLQRSIEIPNIELGHQHALATFVGCMWLGDIHAMLGQIDNAVLYFKSGLEIQREVLGDEDPRFRQTCRYLAEAYVQASRFDEAEKFCEDALNAHKATNAQLSTEEANARLSAEEAANRQLMGLICYSKGKHEDALQHYLLVRTTLLSNGRELDVVTIDCNIGDAYLALARYNEAIFFYQEALDLVSSKDEKHPTIATVFVRLAEVYNKVGKFDTSRSYCEKALDIYNEPLLNANMEDVANGLTNLATIYGSMNEMDQALDLLHKALEIYGDRLEHQCVIAGIEAQIGIIYYMLGHYVDSYNALKNSILRFQVLGKDKSSLYGITLNQLGLTCVQLCAISEASELFNKAKNILEKEYGLHHPDTLNVYSNLAGTYDALGRWDDAIELLEFVLEMREAKLGTADPIVDNEKQRLSELLKVAGRTIRRKSKTLKTLLDEEDRSLTRIIYRSA